MFKKIMLAAIAAAALTACGETKTLDYYQSHPAELAADLAQCKQQGMHTFNCDEANKAMLLNQQKKQ